MYMKFTMETAPAKELLAVEFKCKVRTPEREFVFCKIVPTTHLVAEGYLDYFLHSFGQNFKKELEESFFFKELKRKAEIEAERESRRLDEELEQKRRLTDA